MSDGKIELKLKDWLFNAGLLGFINILETSDGEEKVRKFIDDQNRCLKFSKEELLELLEDFEYKYFDFFIKRYGKTLTYGKILEFEEYIDDFDLDVNDLNEEFRKNINKKIVMIKNAFSNPKKYRTIYSLIGKDFEDSILELEGKIKKLNKNFTVEEIKNNFILIKKIMKYCKQDIYDENKKKKKYFEVEDVKDIIKYGWEGIAFLDIANLAIKRKKGIDVGDNYKVYRDYFIKDVVNYIKENKENNKGFKLKCFISNELLPMPTQKKDDKNNRYLKTIQFLGDFFNPSKKLSNVWNFYNDIYVTPLVYLIYSCVPAGFTYIQKGKGIFVNANNDIENLKKINNAISYNVFEKDKFSENRLYKTIFKEFELQSQDKKYEIADVQVIRTFERKEIKGKSYPVYRFNILSRKTLFFIFQNFDRLNRFFEKYYVLLNDKNEPKWDTVEYLYRTIIEIILESRNLYSTIDKICYIKMSYKKYKCNFYSKDLCDLLEINIKNIRRLGRMEKIEVEETLTLKNITDIKNNAYYFRKRYVEKSNNENKIRGLQYRLQNALRTNNVNLFMDILITAHAYIGKGIHKLFIRALENEDEFKTLGYAFLVGLLNDDNKENQNEGNE